MNFKRIELADREILFPILFSSGRPICDLSFTNLYGWGFLYETAWALEDDTTLVIRFIDKRHNHPVYLLPYCLDLASWRNTITKLEQAAQTEDYPLVFMGVSKECSSLLEEYFPGEFQLIWDDAYVDYIYTRQKLVTLKGKKLQPKRNHINKFKRLFPSWHYEELKASNKQDVLNFTQSWFDASEASEGLKNERIMVERILETEAFETLQLSGGLLYTDKDLVAVTIASPINKNTMDIHVEKAIPNINGAYAMINQSFASTVPESYEYINREEDLGIPGLRFAKESYQPDMRLSKGTAVLRRP